MNLIKKIKGLKLAALLLAAMTCVMAGAENRVYVKPFNIVDETPVVVPVFMTSTSTLFRSASTCPTNWSL